jgi:hypothetical protein
MSLQLVNIQEFVERGVCRAAEQSRLGEFAQRGWARSGELIVDPPIVDPSPVTVTTYQQRKVRRKLVQLTTALELELILFRQKAMLVLKCQIELQKKLLLASWSC